jgi:hypothetical protein
LLLVIVHALFLLKARLGEFRMRPLKGASVNEILDGLNPKLGETTETLRAVTKKVLPNIEWKIKWGNIVYVKAQKPCLDNSL